MFGNCDSRNITCFLCDHIFKSDEESWMIFDGSLERSLSSILSSALRTKINEKTVHSIFLCSDCKALISEFGKLEQRLNEMRKEILNVYNRTANIYGLPIISLDGNMNLDSAESVSCPINDVCSENADGIVFEEFIIKDENNFIDVNTHESNDDFERALPSCKINSFSRDSIMNDEAKNKYKETEFDTEEYKHEIKDNLEEIMPRIKSEFLQDEPNVDVQNEYNEIETVTEIVNQNDENVERSQEPIFSHKNMQNIENVTETSARIITFDVCDEMLITADHENHSECRYPCDICDKLFSTTDTLRQHKKTHIDKDKCEPSFQCNNCEKKFYLRKYLLQHIKRIHNKSNRSEGRFKCNICNEKFYKKNKLVQHLVVHNKEKSFNCDICKKMFSTPDTLRQHEKTHIDKDKCEPSFECDICQNKFYLRKYLLQHIKRTHNKSNHSEAEGRFECNICNKIFYKKNKLVQHLGVHNKVKSFNCDICKTSYTQKRYLSHHKLYVHGERRFCCNVCNRAFKFKSQLKNHESTHVMDGLDLKFECDTCKKIFDSKGNLLQHKVTHSDIRNYLCAVCGMNFKTNRALVKHSVVHIQNHPFVCKVCGKAFKNKGRLINHRRYVYNCKNINENPLPCEVCGKTFQSETGLIIHQRRVNHYNRQPKDHKENEKTFVALNENG